jgi:hypothetical protein
VDWLTSAVDALGGRLTAGSVIGGIAVIIVALRRRRDVDYTEMQKRINALEGRVETLETERIADHAELSRLRDTLVERERIVFQLRSTLARHGIDDPTAAQEAS